MIWQILSIKNVTIHQKSKTAPKFPLFPIVKTKYIVPTVFKQTPFFAFGCKMVITLQINPTNHFSWKRIKVCCVLRHVKDLGLNPACTTFKFLDPEGGSQKATLVILLLVISSQKIPKAFLICSGVQQNGAYTITHLC